MKKQAEAIQLEGMVSLTVGPDDPVAWKLSMLLEASGSKDRSIEQIAKKYSYTREHFYQVLNNFNKKGSKGLEDKPKGPKHNYKRTDGVVKQVIRHRFLDPEASCAVIAQKMQQAGYEISQRSTERIVGEYGLQKRGYILQIRKMKKSQ